MNKKLLISYFTLLYATILQLHAQQLPLYSQYMFNTLEINPAYAGFKDAMQFTAIYRKQFNGIKDAPQTSMASFDMPIGQSKLGFGVKMVDDKISIAQTLGAQGALSYNIEGDNSRVAFGLQFGALNYKVNLTDLNITNPGDPLFNQNLNTLVGNAGAGVFFNTDKYYIGASVPNLIKMHLRETAVELAQYDVKQALHFYINAGMLVDLNDNFILKPSFLVRGVQGIPLNYDINANVFFRDMMSVGLSYRSKSAVVGLMDFRVLPQLRLGYAYDHNVGRLNAFAKGTHEVILRYHIPFDKDTLMPSYLF